MVNFGRFVKNYKKQFKPKYTVIHSTVPVGTSRKLDCLHSPIVGVHPFLKKSILNFEKFISGKGLKRITKELKQYGIKCTSIKNQEDTEAGKLYNLLTYGINVLIEKEIFQYCIKHNLNYNIVYTKFVKMYNEGYQVMNMKNIKMYELKHKEGPIGGHCIMENAVKLNSDFSKILKKLNAKY